MSDKLGIEKGMEIDFNEIADSIWRYVHITLGDDIDIAGDERLVDLKDITKTHVKIFEPYGIIKSELVEYSDYDPDGEWIFSTTDVKFDVDMDVLQQNMPGLRPYMLKYIDTVMKKTCDEYASFEEEDINEIKLDDPTSYYNIFTSMVMKHLKLENMEESNVR